ncbi:MAG: hypothetical protein ACRDGM_16090, partial [bacterium]
MTEAQRELPRYQCHKRVRALKIAAIDACIITPADDRYAAFEVPQEYLAKHQPQPGGYYVVYDDGYESFSPAQTFEQGYTRILSLPH